MNYRLPLTKQNLFRYVSEIDIYRHYWNPEFRLKKQYSSPLRTDIHPSFIVFESQWSDRKYWWKDFGTGEAGDCFDLVARLENTNYWGALFVIANDFGLDLDPSDILNLITVGTRNLSKSVKKVFGDINSVSHSEITLISKVWKQRELSYWKQYYVDQKWLVHYNIHPIYAFSINRSDPIYPGLGFSYSFKQANKIYYKIYQPYSKMKWICNTNSSIIQGYEQLINEKLRHKVLFITKSMKDVVCLRTLGYGAIAPQSETTSLSTELLETLSKYGKKLIILFDNDCTGINRATRLTEETGIRSVFLSGAKDISDYIKLFGQEKAKQHLNSLL